MSEALMEKKNGIIKDKSVKRNRSLTTDRLTEEIKKQPLPAKVKLLATLKESIAKDKKDLQDQLSLIEGTGND